MDTICPPLRWNMVEIGVSRGSYPLLRNFRHLSRMRLKTIVSMIPEPPSADLFQFAKMAGIDLVYIQTNRSGPMTVSLQQCLVQAVNVCINETRHPVYVHCLDGRRIAGLVVIYLRRMQGWTPISAIAEYWRFQTAMRPAVPAIEIDKISRELEKFASEFGEVIIPEDIPRWLWGADKNRNTAVNGVKMKFIPPLRTIQSEGQLNSPLGVSMRIQNESHTRVQDEDGLMPDYLSYLEHDEQQILKLGPGATKALQILRSHSNTPMLLTGEGIMARIGGGNNTRNHIAQIMNTHPLLQSPISRMLDALSLPGLESLSSRPTRGRKVYNGTIAGPGNSLTVRESDRRSDRGLVSGDQRSRSKNVNTMTGYYYSQPMSMVNGCDGYGE